MDSRPSVDIAADVRAVLGEGPIWVAAERTLYWVDIKGYKILRLDGPGAWSEWPTPMRIGSLAPRESGGFIAGTDQGIFAVDLASGRFELVAQPEEHLPDNRFNDGKVDRQGRLWAGSMDDKEKQATGTLYRIDPGLKWTAVDSGYKVTNGPAFSPAGDIMYHNDSALQVTYAFDVADDGSVGERREFARYGETDGHPDGMTVDSDGCLWIAFWGGWCVRRYSPDGKCIGQIEIPAQQPTSCAFGGDNLDQLYITSATVGLDQAALAMQPKAGALFMTVPGVRGLAERPFGG